jgi:hypothetical protein
MAASAPNDRHGSARFVDRALRTIEDATHALRQRLLARELGRTLPREHWTATATDEDGLTAEDLRRHAAASRRRSA